VVVRHSEVGDELVMQKGGWRCSVLVEKDGSRGRAPLRGGGGAGYFRVGSRLL
jgi:hypothetical protein